MRALAMFCAGLALGIAGTLAVGGALRGDAPASPPSPAPPPSSGLPLAEEAPAPPPNRALPSPRATDAPEASCAERLQQLERQNALLQGQLELLGGSRAEWPPDAPAAMQPDAIRAWLAEMDPKLPSVELVELDCDEFPCVAFFRYADGLPADSRTVVPLQEGFHERSEALGLAGVHVYGTAQGAWAALTFGLRPQDGERLLGERLKVRVQQMAEIHLSQ